jgi:outer membrane immunogenic protein
VLESFVSADTSLNNQTEFDMRAYLKLLTAAVLLSAFTFTSVSAADLGAPQKQETYTYDEVPATTWAYMGVNGGWVNSDFTHALTPEESATSSASYGSDDWLLGGHVGVEHQFGKIVLGVEADAEWSDIDVLRSVAPNDRDVVINHSSKVDWLGTLRVRAGYPVGNFMPYVTGGVALADVTDSFTVDGITASYADDTRFGWTAGGGVEINVGNGVKIGGEYLYIDLNDAEVGVGGDVFKSLGKMDVIRGRLSKVF